MNEFSDGLLGCANFAVCNTSSTQDPPVTFESMKAAMAKFKERFPNPIPKQILVASDKGLEWLRSQMPTAYGSAPADLLYGLPLVSRKTEWEAWKVALDYNEDGYEVLFLKDSGAMHKLLFPRELPKVEMMQDGEWKPIGRLAGPITITNEDGLTSNQRKRRAKRIRLVEIYANRRASAIRSSYVIRDRLLKRWGLPVPKIMACCSADVMFYMPKWPLRAMIY